MRCASPPENTKYMQNCPKLTYSLLAVTDVKGKHPAVGGLIGVLIIGTCKGGLPMTFSLPPHLIMGLVLPTFPSKKLFIVSSLNVAKTDPRFIWKYADEIEFDSAGDIIYCKCVIVLMGYVIIL